MQFNELSSMVRASEPESMPFIDHITGEPAKDENGDAIVFMIVGAGSKELRESVVEINRLESEGNVLSDDQKHALQAAYAVTSYTGCLQVGESPLDISDKKKLSDMLLSDPNFELLNQILSFAGKKQARAISSVSSRNTKNSPGSKRQRTTSGSRAKKQEATEDQATSRQS